MRRLLLLSLFCVGVADLGLAQRGGRNVTRQPAAQPADAQERGKGTGTDADKGQRSAPPASEALAALRRSFGEEYFQRKVSAGEELAAARERAGSDEAAFAAARTEIARRYRGELAALRTAYTEKAKGLGVSFELPGDDLALEKLATEVAPAASLRADFTNQVAALAAAAQKELAEARTATGADDAAFGARRTEIARKYRGQVVALQQAFSEKAAGLGVSVDVSDVSKVMGAIAAAEAAAPAPPGPAPAPAGPAPARPAPAKPNPAPAGPAPAPAPKAGDDAAGQPAPKPGPKPIDAETLRKAFTAQVDALRSSLAAELAALEGAEKGDAATAKRTAVIAKFREQLASYRATVQARAQAAGVTLALPTDAELVPELAPAPNEAPPRPTEKPQEGTPEGTPGGTPGQRPTEAPPRPAPGPGGKSGRGPRFGGG